MNVPSHFRRISHRLAAPVVVAAVMLGAACAPAAQAPQPTTPPPAVAKPTLPPAAPTPPPAAPTAAQPVATVAAPAPTTAAKPTATSAGPLQLTKPLPPMNPIFTVKARVGNSLTTAPFWYAIEKGYLDQLGLKFEQVDIANSGDVVAPLATGQIDLAGTSFGSGLYNAINRDIPVKAVADNGQLAQNLAGAAAVVKKGELSKYGTDWCAIKGKKVAVVSRTTGLFVTLVKALEQCQLTENDVQVVELGFAETNAAISNGAVDVGFQVEPFVSRGVQAGLLDLWKPLDQAYLGQQMNMLLYSPEFLKNKDAGLRFMVAYLAGARDYRRAIEGTGSKEEMDRILAKYLNVSDPTAFNSMIMMGVDPDGKIDVPSIQQSLQIFQDTGAVPKGDVKLDWISDDFRSQALEYLGPYKP